MNILSISSLLPVPGIININDFVFETYLNYKKKYVDDNIVIIKPLKYSLKLYKTYRKHFDGVKEKNRLTWIINNFQVEIFPFLSAWSIKNIHAIIIKTIFHFNKKRISSLISLYNFDIIHAQYIFPDGMLAYILNKKFNIPYIITTHNELTYFKHPISGRIALNILKNAYKVVPISYINYSYFKSQCLTNINLKPLGFNRSFLRNQKSTYQKNTKILTVAELRKLKNIDQVILTIKKLVPKYDISYTIIGKGQEKKYLSDLVDSLNLNSHIHFIDSIPHDQIANEMYKYDIFIMPSYFETFGRVYFEAMAMGIPIICAKNSGIYGYFKEMKEGISVNHNDINQILQALEYLIANPKKRVHMGKKGQELVKHYTWENIVERIHDIYIEAINK